MLNCTIAYDAKLKRPGCVLIQSAIASISRALLNKYFDVEDWLTAPTPDMGIYPIESEEQLRSLSFITKNRDLTAKQVGADKQQSKEVLAPLWRRLRRVKTSKAQALVVWEASGLIEEMGYHFMPNFRLIGDNTRYRPIAILDGYAQEMTLLMGAQNHYDRKHSEDNNGSD